jgi:hypothetical protein
VQRNAVQNVLVAPTQSSAAEIATADAPMPPKKKITNATNLLKGCVPVAHIPFLVSGGSFDVNTLQPARSTDQKPQAYIEKIFKKRKTQTKL